MVRSGFFLLPLFGFGVVHASLYANSTRHNHTCWLDKPVLSCSQASLNLADLDTCCTETYGGLVVATQFWDTHTGMEKSGQLLPNNHWTIHGLWPEFCNCTFTQYCDLSRQYDPHPSPKTQNGKEDGTIVSPWNGNRCGRFYQGLGTSRSFGLHEFLLGFARQSQQRLLGT